MIGKITQGLILLLLFTKGNFDPVLNVNRLYCVKIGMNCTNNRGINKYNSFDKRYHLAFYIFDSYFVRRTLVAFCCKLILTGTTLHLTQEKWH
jgi:hypothetical protein